ncbi:MAG: hypothetical protein ACJA0U_001858 [Salibacteraceae bacterium]|jgi:hypothetical protein
MHEANRQVGDSPQPHGPSKAYLASDDNFGSSYVACGSSGLSGGGSCI